MRHHIAILALIPLAAVVALMVTETRVTVPVFGRDYVLRFDLPWGGDGVTLPQVSGPEGDQYPLVLLDPGHGGFDYGATGVGHKEKDLVLGLSVALRDRLLEAGDIRVAMTRDDDSFLSLDDRLTMARELGADVFLSIHADSAGEKSDVAGASIYTLSESASSRAAAQFAARENAADQINGVSMSGKSREVNDILLDLSRRQTQSASQELANIIQRSGEGRIRFHPQTLRSASLVVLGSPDTPSVLFESGFVTNERDAARLASAEGRANFAEAMASALRAYFVREESTVLPSDR